MLTRWHETSDGRFKVSTPELTALDLVQRAIQVGGSAWVLEVLRSLWGSCSPSGLAQALDAAQEVPAAQRLGALLALERQQELAACVARYLRDRTLRRIALEEGIR